MKCLSRFPVQILLTALLCSFGGSKNAFRHEQMKAPKGAQSYREKWPVVASKLNRLFIDTTHFTLFIRVFKQERVLEAWVRSGSKGPYKPYQAWPVCASSGEPGPKRREGDGQVPEGFYRISVFNPYSNYFVSLGLNYPNASDRILGDKKRPGGAIMIHGNCVTIGCIPLTDEVIKELYVLASEARNGGQEDIQVDVFPCRLSKQNLATLEKARSQEPALLAFWRNLKTGYDSFEMSKIPPEVSTAINGAYVFR
ncbi:MAG TPA: L,D-transpeptidase family protein [Bacteroidia bacterium]|jgi:murein L,D-transpeptidase YafK|nr:L,D-transpeptidase family protein [Bacteroidia bacterium]